MNARLADFQDGFAAALLDPDAASHGPLRLLASQPGFAVYRNTVMKGCIDAMQANYPAVARLVGEEWFRAAAAVYSRAHAPRVPMLAEYGNAFADFLETFEPARALPYLPDVARLDRHWTEAHAAPDQPLLEPEALSRFRAEALADARLAVHASARWRWFANMPIYSIWSGNRDHGGDRPGHDAELDWRAEGAIIARARDGAVRWGALGRGGCAFLDACAAGSKIADAAGAALAAEPDLDLARLTATLLAAGAFRSLQPDASPNP